MISPTTQSLHRLAASAVAALLLFPALADASPASPRVLFHPSRQDYPFGITGKFDFGDLNGDGVLDMVAPHGDAVAVFLGHAEGTFADPVDSQLDVIVFSGKWLTSLIEEARSPTPMRKRFREQQVLTQGFIDHEHARELETVSALLDQVPDVLSRIERDLVGDCSRKLGRCGMTAEQVLRAAIVRQLNGFSYAELAFHLVDSRTYRRFCRFGEFEKPPSRSTLQANIKRISAESFESVNRRLIRLAEKQGIEKGKRIRVDTTSVESNIHEPTDSLLLWDVNRVLTRLLKAAKPFGIPFTDHTRAAKRRAFGIQNSRSRESRYRQYQDLVKMTEELLATGWLVLETLEYRGYADSPEGRQAKRLAKGIARSCEIGERVVNQTRGRVFEGKKVPASEKVVSIFETHTDILVKGRQKVEYGHKVNLAVGQSSLVTDCVIEKGNPADSTLAVKMIDRHRDLYGRPPSQAAFDGGFASAANVREIKMRGVRDVAFAKRCGLSIDDMVKSIWVYKRLKRFRAGIEGVISFLKRCFGLDRCTWRGFRSFRAYVWSAVLSANLLIFSRQRIATSP
jgi:IS5 family transposase